MARGRQSADLRARVAEFQAELRALAAARARPVPAGADGLDVQVLADVDVLLAADPSLSRDEALLSAWWAGAR